MKKLVLLLLSLIILAPTVLARDLVQVFKDDVIPMYYDSDTATKTGTYSCSGEFYFLKKINIDNKLTYMTMVYEINTQSEMIRLKRVIVRDSNNYGYITDYPPREVEPEAILWHEPNNEREKGAYIILVGMASIDTKTLYLKRY